MLHRKANITNLLTRHLHQTAQHAGPSTLLGLLTSTHHVIGAKHLVREISRTCVVCQKVYAKPVNQVMGPLPPSHLTPAPPFMLTGADFAGPLTLKQGNSRNPSFIKAYICCMSTKAIHLELVTDHSTEASFACFRRSVSRRICPMTLRTDNGTNFVGAWRELHVIYLPPVPI